MGEPGDGKEKGGDLLELVIGVSGHRFLAEVDKLVAAVREALRMAQAAYPGRRLLILSSLAEGADRLVADEVLAIAGSRLVAILPLPPEEYRKDFGTDASQAEFDSLLARADEVRVLPPTATRNEAYEQAGLAVADGADALIALWDGQGAQGQGGTAEIVYRALDRGIPVFHVRAGNRKPGTTEPTTLGAEQGELVVHNLTARSGGEVSRQ
jgi:hypothetical protein